MSLRSPGPLGPYKDVVAVTPDNAATFAKGACDALVCTGTAGTVAVVLQDGSSVTLDIEKGFAVRMPVRCIGVKATGTTATTLFALYV